MLMGFSKCDAVELRLRDSGLHYRWEATRRPKPSFRFVILPGAQKEDGEIISRSPASGLQNNAGLERLCRDVVRGHFDPSLPFFTRNGSFWTGDTERPLRLGSRRAFSDLIGTSTASRSKTNRRGRAARFSIGGSYRSLALIRFAVDDKTVGLLQLKSKRRNHFTKDEIELYEGLARTLGLAVANRRAQWALRERVKELTCLYGIARVAQRPGLSLKESLQGIAELLPPAWQYPEIASARILLEGRSYCTSGFQEGRHRQTADITVSGVRRGVVEVIYAQDKPEFAEGPFLKEEQSLIDTVAREVALILERREAEDYQSKLQDQLRHADRLATIGQLAAGVAHELNEPLGNILGFAQLAKKGPRLPKRAAEDMEKIVAASLHAREVIHKLLIFARQMPPRKTQVNLNQIVEEGVYFLESRCAKGGIELIRSLSPNLPEISADPSQLHQVLVNLVVNAVQAMPEGGRLTIETLARPGHVSLIVEDTGIGMSEEVRKKIFIPFFTTKDVDQGTGLGLAVVHGIVTTHRGSIQVESEVGRGTRFEIQLPLRGPSEAEKSG
jgi:signal transduction histidine kinase